ncbi:putative DNA-directed RNA polymerase III subunit rpc6 [Cocos nucifera]|nr:putative DNA-directed RNA polymerase III subunit rpc6 [Cocos nucifera]
MKRDTGLQTTVITNTLKSLQNKSVINVSKARKIYMAVESEPSEEISGGSWYSDGSLDTDFIRILREQCLKHIERL